MKTLTFNQLVRDLATIKIQMAKTSSNVKPEQPTKSFLEVQADVRRYKQTIRPSTGR